MWFLRAYTTQENSGDSYATTLTAITINNAWKENARWFRNMIRLIRDYLRPSIMTHADAYARAIADSGRYLPGTTQYKMRLIKL